MFTLKGFSRELFYLQNSPCKAIGQRLTEKGKPRSGEKQKGIWSQEPCASSPDTWAGILSTGSCHFGFLPSCYMPRSLLCQKITHTAKFCSQTRAHACMHTHSPSFLMFPEGGAGLKNIRNFSSQIQFLLMLTSLTPWPFQVGVFFLESALNG